MTDKQEEDKRRNEEETEALFSQIRKQAAAFDELYKAVFGEDPWGRK